MITVVRWKIATFLLAGACLALAYRVFDQGLTATYTHASLATSDQHIELLKGLIKSDWKGLEDELVMKRLQSYVDSQPSKGIVLKWERDDGEITLDGVRFRFRDHRLIAIE